MHAITVDRYDLALLDALQRDGHATNARLGEAAKLSASQVSRRVQRLEESGVIASYAALLDPATIGLGVTAFAQVRLERHGDARSEKFAQAIDAIAEVVECYAVAGATDYVLRIVAPDLAAFSDLMTKRLLTLPGVAQITTNIALQQVKHTHILPLAHVQRPPPARARISFAG